LSYATADDNLVVGDERVAMSRTYQVDAHWDPEAGVWVAESDDIPGLVAEAESMKSLVEKVRALVPELFE
jgi:predicted RNase H-like HicB family nuclease